MKNEKNRDEWIAQKILEGKYNGFYQLKWWALDSFSAFPVLYEGKTYATAEHLYQAAKFLRTSPETAKLIRNAASPLDAKELAHLPENKKLVRSDWDSVKADVMKDICLHKLDQHPYIKRKLIESGDHALAEFSPSDYYWGIGEDGSGRNMLGKIWEQIREAVKEGSVLP